MKFSASATRSGLYEARFSRRTDVPAFAVAVRETEFLRRQDTQEPHQLADVWSQLCRRNNVLLGTLPGMEETARMLGTFATRTYAAVEEINSHHAPYQDPVPLRAERYDVGSRSATLASDIRGGLARHVVVNTDVLADEFDFYMELKTAGDDIR